MSPEKRLKELGIVLPKPAKPLATYVPTVRTGNLVFVAGQVPFRDGIVMHPGLLGREISIEQGASAAKQCAINILVQMNEATGHDLSKIVRIVKLVGFVACIPEFTDHPKVVNGASDFMVEIFGERGKHARSAVGMASLPLNAPVEVEAIIEVE